MKHTLNCMAIVTLFAAPSMAESPFSKLSQTAPTNEVEKIVVRPANQSIIAQSTILNDGDSWTLLPQGAVLHVPAAMQAKVNARPVGQLLPWPDFLIKNRAWLGTQEVDLAQASGQQPIAAEHFEAWKKQGRVIVAVRIAGPISVLPPRAPESTETPTASN